MGDSSRLFRVTNTTHGAVLADSCRRASNPVSRGVGLIGRKSLPAGGGLIIQPCKSVTCFFMRFPIDVLFLDGDGSVRHAIHRLRPWRTSKIVRGAKLVVELPAGTLTATNTSVGDSVAIQPTS